MMTELVRKFDQEDWPYLSRARPMMENARYLGDYDHLARVREWALVESADGRRLHGGAAVRMTAHAQASEIDTVTARTTADASNPAQSAWVSANAGSGKTFVLSRRVIRLLLAGVDPSRILCLTFTKAAAAEMAKRVFADPRIVDGALRRRAARQR